MLRDPRKEPPEHVILLDDSLVEQPLCPKERQLSLGNHEAPSLTMVAFTRSPQRMYRRPPPGPSGSKAEIPDDTRS